MQLSDWASLSCSRSACPHFPLPLSAHLDNVIPAPTISVSLSFHSQFFLLIIQFFRFSLSIGDAACQRITTRDHVKSREAETGWRSRGGNGRRRRRFVSFRSDIRVHPVICDRHRGVCFSVCADLHIRMHFRWSCWRESEHFVLHCDIDRLIGTGCSLDCALWHKLITDGPVSTAHGSFPNCQHTDDTQLQLTTISQMSDGFDTSGV